MMCRYMSIIVWLFTFALCCETQIIDDTTRLHDDLMAGYNKDVLPAFDQSKPVIVYVSFDLVSIRELDEIMGKLSIVGMLWFFWEDPRITWNPFAYNSTFTVRLPIKKVWKPDLVIAYPVETTIAVGFNQHWYPVRYFYNGSAYWTPGDVMTTTCNIDVTYYPFDTQSCEVVFTPWGAFASEIFLQSIQQQVSLKWFTHNGEWSVEKAESNSVVMDGLYTAYIVSFELRRRPTFIIINVVLPIMFMGFLNVLVFTLPANSGERISFAITTLLAIAVFLTLVGDNMPKTSQPMSTICYFLLTNLVLSSLIMIVTILNLNIFHKDPNIKVPKWLVACVLFTKCKKAKTLTKVEQFKEKIATDDGEVEGDGNMSEQQKCDTWALPAYHEDADSVSWQDVSKMIDIIFGTTSIIWLVITAVSFLTMVATQSVPGAK